MERSIADVAFDSFVFGHDLLCADSPDANRAALERGRRTDGVVLAVGSVEWSDLPPIWIAAQSKRGADHLGLRSDPPTGGAADPASHVEAGGLPMIGHARFDATFDLDADDDAMGIVRRVLTAELCDWAVDLDERHGPLVVIFDGAEPGGPDEAPHGSAVFVAREVSTDDAFVATLGITTALVDKFRVTVRD